MYESFFGLQSRPFAATPNQAFFVPLDSAKATFSSLIRAVDADQGIALLTGAAGTGKTQVCLQLKAHFAGNFRTVVLTNSSFASFRALLQAVMFELDEPYLQFDEQELRLGLKAATRKTCQQERGILLIADEAHLLGKDVLTEIRSLCNLVEDGESLIRVVLSGQPSLEETLAEPGLEEFNQRIGCQVLLEPFTRQESISYICKRIEIAGGDAASLLTDDAVRLIAFAADGLPRCLNQLCDQSLMLAFAKNQTLVDESHVREALDILKQMPLHWNIPARPESDEEPAEPFSDHADLSHPEEPVSTATETMHQPLAVQEFGAVEFGTNDSRPALDADSDTMNTFEPEPTAVEFGHRADEVSAIEVPVESSEPAELEELDVLDETVTLEIDDQLELAQLDVAVDLEAIEEQIRESVRAAEPAALTFDGSTVIEFSDDAQGESRLVSESAGTPKETFSENATGADRINPPSWTRLTDLNPGVSVEIINDQLQAIVAAGTHISDAFDTSIHELPEAQPSEASVGALPTGASVTSESSAVPESPETVAVSFEMPRPGNAEPQTGEVEAGALGISECESATECRESEPVQIEEIEVLDRYAVLDSGRPINTFEEMLARNPQQVPNETERSADEVNPEAANTEVESKVLAAAAAPEEFTAQDHAIEEPTIEADVNLASDEDSAPTEAITESGDWSGVVDVIDRIVPLVDHALETGNDPDVCDDAEDGTNDVGFAAAESTGLTRDSSDTSPLWYALNQATDHSVHIENDATSQLEQWTTDNEQDEESQIGSAVLDVCLEAKRAIGDRIVRIDEMVKEQPASQDSTDESSSRSIDRLFDTGIEGYVESLGELPAAKDERFDDVTDEFSQSDEDFDIVLPEDEVELTDSREAALRDAFTQAPSGRSGVRTPKFSQLFTRLRRRQSDGQ